MSAENRLLLKKLIEEFFPGRGVEVPDDNPVEIDGRWYCIYENSKCLAMYVKTDKFPKNMPYIDRETRQTVENIISESFEGWLPVESAAQLNYYLEIFPPAKPD